ncbi:hypothetical protein EBQ34_14145 [Vandammella animalimorsus]|uniref:HTH cro/C1-type domain-containing protein n=1 Tax=Vandammella animalimorsus TaxID=2029117 RepID=A0A3M6R192_9BURK|nr:helix-turn-helix domain-containing protein [Vandammella animalimorsus]RMX09028.1 hypothetical protein EBQ34_14145 [Vandammella animalimorsus]
MQLKDLIEEAAAIAGSQSALAEILGLTKQNISNMKTGKRTCSTRLLTQIADVAGYEPGYFVVQAVIHRLEQSDDPLKREAAEEIKKATKEFLKPEKRVQTLP